ncbi:MAG: FAD-binding oxidoreductase [Dehalococcoidia bacterium]
MSVALAEEMRSALERLCGEGCLLPDERLGEYTLDGLTPRAVVSPRSVEEVAQILALAQDEGWAVTPWGGGTQQTLGTAPRRLDLVLETHRLCRVLAHRPEDLTARVEAGITLGTLQRELARRGQFLPLEAPFPEEATIGGILAVGASGPGRLFYGTPRDWLIGIRVVHPGGTVSKSGGDVVKNVTGYDLNKLYTGSLGTLGVIVEAAFKLAPLSPRQVTLLSAFDSVEVAVQVAQKMLALGFIPRALEVLDATAWQALPGREGLEVLDSGGVLAARLAGRASAVARQTRELTGVLERHGARTPEQLDGAGDTAFWEGLASLGWGQQEDALLMVKLSVPPAHVDEAVEGVRRLAEELPLALGLVVGVGHGLLRTLWWPAADALKSESIAYAGLVQRVREIAGGLGGHAVVERAPQQAKPLLDVWGEPGGGLAVMRRIKEALDPKGMLNPGRFVGGI